MRSWREQNGFGLIQVLMLVAFISVVISGAVAWNESLGRTRMDLADRTNLLIFKRSISTAIKSDSSWRQTVALNGGMGCLRNSAGTSCTFPSDPETFPEFNLYTAGNQLIFGSASSGFNGITKEGIPCGPNAPPGIYRNYRFPSSECPYRMRLQWRAMTYEALPYVAIIATLKVASSQVAPSLMPLNPANYDFSLNQMGLYVAGGVWNPNLIYRRALP